MFDLLQRAWVLSRRPPLDDVIREISKRSIADVRRRLCASARNMSEAELRGYVRARGARLVQCAAERLAEEQGWRIALTDSLIAKALERTVLQIVYQMRMQSIVATSAAQATLRVAA